MRKHPLIHLQLLIAIMALAYIGCFRSLPSVEEHKIDENPIVWRNLADSISTNVAQNLVEKYGLHFCGTSGSMVYDVKSLGLLFQSTGNLDKENGRRIIIDCVESFLKAINENKEIRPYLHTYPFTPKDVDVAIYGYGTNFEKNIFPQYGIVSAYYDKIFFYSRNSSDEALIKETENYSEARKKVLGF